MSASSSPPSSGVVVAAQPSSSAHGVQLVHANSSSGSSGGSSVRTANIASVSRVVGVDFNQYRVPPSASNPSPSSSHVSTSNPSRTHLSQSAEASAAATTTTTTSLPGNYVTHPGLVAAAKPSQSASSVTSSSSSIPVMTSPPLSAQDYPIRGTMSPLTSEVGGGLGGRGEGGCKGQGGESGEDGGPTLSFVFGRPATPDFKVRCSSPPVSISPHPHSHPHTHHHHHHTQHPHPSSLPTSKRPLSPQSRDGLPARRSASGGNGHVIEREVMSPPPLSSWGEGRMVQGGGVCCEQCNGCLIEFKRQALRLMFPDNGSGKPCLPQVRHCFSSTSLLTCACDR